MSQDAEHRTERWQIAMRPIMTLLLICLSAFFFLATLFQLMSLQTRIAQAPALVPSALLEQTRCPPALEPTACEQSRRLSLAAALEAGMMNARRHQDGVLLMSMIWIRYLGFITGMVLALMGAAFVLGKLRDEGSHVQASGPRDLARVALRTSSPGLLLTLCGTALILATLLSKQSLETDYAAVYFTTLPPPVSMHDFTDATPSPSPADDNPPAASTPSDAGASPP